MGFGILERQSTQRSAEVNSAPNSIYDFALLPVGATQMVRHQSACCLDKNSRKQTEQTGAWLSFPKPFAPPLCHVPRVQQEVPRIPDGDLLRGAGYCIGGRADVGLQDVYSASGFGCVVIPVLLKKRPNLRVDDLSVPRLIES
ncbi:MAG: hypothetical protein JWN34_5400 [Bryobacterales bacterium]|nr:hypothetical protein [Bryobacterales bacterium]